MSEDLWRPQRIFISHAMDTDPDLLLKIRNLIAEAARAGPMPVTLNLALTADTWLRGVDFWERVGDRTLAFQVKHTPAATVAIAGNATATARAAASAEITSPAAETHSIDYQLWAAVLLCIISWLVYFVGPHLIAKQPSADQATLNDYWSIDPAIAIPLTAYVVARMSAKSKRK